MKQRFVPSAAAVFLVALLIRLFHIWQLRRSPFFAVLMGDAQGYHEWAHRIAGGEWIGSDVFYQAPLYPYFLAVVYSLFGENLPAVRVIQALLGSASCALMTLAGRRFLSPRAGLVAGLALAVYAPAIFFDTLIQKSVLDLFFLSLALWLLAVLTNRPDQPRIWLSLGVVLGALSLTRENAVVFIVVILAWCLWRPAMARPHAGGGGRQPAERGRRGGAAQGKAQVPAVGRGATAAALVVGLTLVLLPVALRNYAVGGGFYLTTAQFGPNFYIGNNPRSDGTYMSLRFGRGAPEYERMDATELAQHALGRPLTPAEVSTYWTDQALDFITGHPGAWLRLMGRKFLLLWNADEMLDTESQESYADWSWPLRLGGWFGHFGVLVPLALAGAIAAWPDRRRLAILYAMTLAYTASVLLFYVFARYRLPLVPLLILFASVPITSAIDWIDARYVETRDRRGRGEDCSTDAPIAAASNDPDPRRTPRPRRESTIDGRKPLARTSSIAAAAPTPALIVAIVAVVFTNWPLLSKPMMRAITENNLATALHAAGRSDDAVAHYRRAIAIQPDYAPAYNNLGVVLRAQGHVDEAVDTYYQALAANREYPDAHYNLANALLQQNRAEEAAEHFRIALQSIPDSAGVRNNLGIALAAGGKPEDAIAAFRAAVDAEPGSARAHRNLGDSLANAGRVDEGIAELRRAATLDPRDAAARYNLGSVLLEAGRLDEAIAEFQATLELSPQSAEARNNLGIAFGSQGRLDAAIDQFQQALAIDPGFADAQRNLAMATEARDQVRGRP